MSLLHIFSVPEDIRHLCGLSLRPCSPSYPYLGAQMWQPDTLGSLSGLTCRLVINHCKLFPPHLPPCVWSLQHTSRYLSYHNRATEPGSCLELSLRKHLSPDTPEETPGTHSSCTEWREHLGRQVLVSTWMVTLQLTPAAPSSGNPLLCPETRLQIL